jgi:hypothetical protein
MAKTRREPNAYANKEPGVFYLVLHGEIAIFDSNNPDGGLTIYTPDIPEHVYMAGPWLGEERVQRGVGLELVGLQMKEEGTAMIQDLAQNFLVFWGGMPRPVSTYMEIRVRRPNKIWPCMVLPLQKDAVSQLSGVSVVLPDGANYPPSIAQCTVFEYDLESGAQPRLQQSAGPKPTIFSDWCAGKNAALGSCSLHVYAEGDSVETQAHAEASFQLALRILGADNGVLNATKNTMQTPTSKPDFLAEEEYSYSLAGRIQSLRGLPSASIERRGIKSLPAFSVPFPPGDKNDEYTCGNIAMIP